MEFVTNLTLKIPSAEKHCRCILIQDFCDREKFTSVKDSSRIYDLRLCTIKRAHIVEFRMKISGVFSLNIHFIGPIEFSKVNIALSSKLLSYLQHKFLLCNLLNLILFIPSYFRTFRVKSNSGWSFIFKFQVFIQFAQI